MHRPSDREGIEMEYVPKYEENDFEIQAEESAFAGSVGNGILKLKNEAKVCYFTLYLANN